MTETTPKRVADRQTSAELARREREAEALRANLARRKAQSRARRDAEASGPEKSGPETSKQGGAPCR